MSGLHVDLTDVYQPRSSPVHRLDPRARVVTALLFIVAAGITAPGAWVTYGILELLLVTSSCIARLGPLHAIRRSIVALPFVLAALPLAFTTPGPPLLHVPLLGAISGAGLARVATILARAWLSVQAAILLTATTRFPDLLWALGRLGLPRALVTIVGLGYRYLFVLADEVSRMARARRARCGRLSTAPGRPPVMWQAQVAGRMVGTLLIRSLERSERVYFAMASRGYDGTPRTAAPFQLAWRDLALVLGAAAALALIVHGSWSPWGTS